LQHRLADGAGEVAHDVGGFLTAQDHAPERIVRCAGQHVPGLFRVADGLALRLDGADQRLGLRPLAPGDRSQHLAVADQLFLHRAGRAQELELLPLRREPRAHLVAPHRARRGGRGGAACTARAPGPVAPRQAARFRAARVAAGIEDVGGLAVEAARERPARLSSAMSSRRTATVLSNFRLTMLKPSAFGRCTTRGPSRSRMPGTLPSQPYCSSREALGTVLAIRSRLTCAAMQASSTVVLKPRKTRSSVSSVMNIGAAPLNLRFRGSFAHALAVFAPQGLAGEE